MSSNPYRTPAADLGDDTPPASNLITRSWRGHEPLWKVFWLYQFVIGIGVNLALSFAVDNGSPALIAPVLAFMVVWTVWILVAMWRCAFNVNARFWGYLVRGLVVFSVFGIVVSIAVPLVTAAQI